MEKPAQNARVQSSSQGELPAATGFGAVLWRCAVDAFIQSILVNVFGSVAISLSAGIWQQMAPSAPPDFEAKPEAEGGSSVAWRSWGATLNRERFWLIFGVIFLTTAWVRLRSCTSARPPSRLAKLGKHLSEQWFGLIVGNAFGAMISAMVLVWVQQFSLTRLVFGWLAGAAFAGVGSLVREVLGPGRGNTLRAWFDWYGQNQYKLSFWFLYLAAVCDDLGVPNLKTLGRWLARRVRASRAPAN